MIIVENLEPEKYGKAKFFLAFSFLEGHYIKYNNNYGWRRAQNESANLLAQAFSHFTFEYSMGTMLVIDIQGVNSEEGNLTITDPAIHSAHYKDRYGETNHGKIGIIRFFMSHTCNEYCKRLYLTDPNDLNTAQLAKVREAHKKDKDLDHIYKELEIDIKKWKMKFAAFDPMKDLKISVVQEEDEEESGEVGTMCSGILPRNFHAC